MEPWTKNDASKEELEASLNQSLVNYIDNNLPELEGKLEQAIGIYVLLNSILCYDDRYIKSKSFKEIEKINNINEENPYSVCRQWAIIYQKLLDYYNIKSSVHGNYHLSTVIFINDVIYHTDGFNMEDLSDVARTHFGLRIKKFNVLDIKDWNILKERIKEKELENKIDIVYQKLHIKTKTEEELETRLEKLTTYLASRNNFITKQEIQKRIRILNWFYQHYSRTNIEKYQFTKKYDHYLFDDFPKDVIESTSIYDSSNENIRLLKAYRIKDIENNMHFYIQGTAGFREYNISEIEANLTNEMCILKHPMQREHFFGLERIQYLKTKRIKQ